MYGNKLLLFESDIKFCTEKLNYNFQQYNVNHLDMVLNTFVRQHKFFVSEIITKIQIKNNNTQENRHYSTILVFVT